MVCALSVCVHMHMESLLRMHLIFVQALPHDKKQVEQMEISYLCEEQEDAYTKTEIHNPIPTSLFFQDPYKCIWIFNM